MSRFVVGFCAIFFGFICANEAGDNWIYHHFALDDRFAVTGVIVCAAIWGGLVASR